MKHLMATLISGVMIAGFSTPAAAQWVYKPSRTDVSVEKGVTVYRGPAPAVDQAALDARLAGASPRATESRPITVRVRVDPTLRYPPRRRVVHGFVGGARRYYRSIGPVPGRTFAPWFDQFPGGY